MKRKLQSGLALAGAILGNAVFSSAAIVYDAPAGDSSPPPSPANNTILTTSVGNWDGGGGVVISSNSFISAQHLDVNFNNGTFDLNGTNYQTVSHELISGTDLIVWQINGAFPSTAIAPLYSSASNTEVGQAVALVGYGFHTQGNPVITNGVNNGWYWAGNKGLNYGQNTISAVTADGPGNSHMIDFLFKDGTDSIYAADDSGGGAFIYNNGEYQLAGIAYGITEYFIMTAPNTYVPVSDNGGDFDAAIYNGTGLYVTDGMGNYYSATGVVDGVPVDALNQEGDASEIAFYLTQIEIDASLPVPEPGSMALIAAGSLLLLHRWRRAGV